MTDVYRNPIKTARKLILNKNTLAVFIEYNESWAKIQNPINGVYGYINIEQLAIVPTAWTW